MNEQAKPVVMIASWPARKVDMPIYDGTSCVSYKLPLRLVRPGDRWSVGDEGRAHSDLCIYVWADVDGSVSIDVRVSEIYSANIRELEMRLKLLKRFTAKAEKAGFSTHAFKRQADVFEEMVRCVDALGIRQTVQYHGIGADDTYAPVSVAIKQVADAMNASLNQIRQRKAA